MFHPKNKTIEVGRGKEIGDDDDDDDDGGVVISSTNIIMLLPSNLSLSSLVKIKNKEDVNVRELSVRV